MEALINLNLKDVKRGQREAAAEGGEGRDGWQEKGSLKMR